VRVARQEEEREDLLAQATAFVERIEFEVAGMAEPVVIGFRRDGSGSLYLGQQEAFHFNARHQFRRGFRDGRLIKAEKGRLVELQRERTTQAVLLIRHELDDAEHYEYLANVRNHVRVLHEQAQQGILRVTRCVPAECSVARRVRDWLEELDRGFEVADRL
jgi:hypothetical protein